MPGPAYSAAPGPTFPGSLRGRIVVLHDGRGWFSEIDTVIPCTAPYGTCSGGKDCPAQQEADRLRAAAAGGEGP